MDRALWASWYDVADSNREAYLKWAHDTYIPKLIQRPGFAWGAHFKCEVPSGPPGGGRLRHTDDPAVPAGNAYIMLFGGETAHAFARPAPPRLHAELFKDGQKMLAMRERERVNIFTEEDREDGLDAKKRDARAALSPCIQLGSFGAGTADEDDLMSWYAQVRLPSMKQLPGCIGIRKMVSVSGWAKHGVLYEFESLAARNEHFPDHDKGKPDWAAWTDRLVRKLLHAPGSPNVAQRIFSAVR